MVKIIKNLIKSLLPAPLLKWVRPYYHGSMSQVASYWFGQPSRRLAVIGVTGTKGKTTTVNLIAEILTRAGYKTGFASTATYNIDGQTHLNTFKMSTLSGWTLQKWLAAMAKAGCQYAVLEMTSEGLAQNRHLNIHFDAAVFTNLTPEHMDAHGGFDNYKRAKGILFKYLTHFPTTPEKLRINPQLEKVIIANLDSEYGTYYLNFKADRHITYGMQDTTATVTAKSPQYSPAGVAFDCQNLRFETNLKGQFDVYNALAAIATAISQGISPETSQQALNRISVVPGRMEAVQEQPFLVIVDYAHEPTGMQQLYETVSRWPKSRIIHVLGPTGGGRDMSNKIELGRIAGQNADLVIITTDDPYDDDPAEIAAIMAQGVEAAGKIKGQGYIVELDRRLAIRKAVNSAGSGDLVLITGKGSEQKMVLPGGRMIDWDDRTVAREELAKLSSLDTDNFNNR